jgi:hypothetical protein
MRATVRICWFSWTPCCSFPKRTPKPGRVSQSGVVLGATAALTSSIVAGPERGRETRRHDGWDVGYQKRNNQVGDGCGRSTAVVSARRRQVWGRRKRRPGGARAWVTSHQEEATRLTANGYVTGSRSTRQRRRLGKRWESSD